MNVMDGHAIFNLFMAGAKRVHELRRELDRINVFPVPDGDTGSNMSFTLAAAVSEARADRSVAAVARSLADSALAGARGNSGVIVAQFITGFGEAVADSVSLSLRQFASSCVHASRRAQDAIAHPAEGTILSAIKAWAAALESSVTDSPTLSHLLEKAHPSLEEAVRRGPDRLPELKAAGVVDAGAKGFEAFVSGFRDFAEGRIDPGDLASAAFGSVAPSIEPEAEAHGSRPTLRYCCEFLMEARPGHSLDLDRLRAELDQEGDSLIVAGGNMKARVHIHADDPSRIAGLLSAKARLIEQKADDMLLQYLDAHERLSDVAILTDSACDLPAELALKYRIHQVPLYVRFGDEEYLDKLTVTPDSFYDRAERGPYFPKSSQPTALAFSRAYATLASHYRSVIAIHLASTMSGTYEASRREAERVAASEGVRIDVFDSRHLSGSLGLIVLEAARMAESGSSHEQIMEALPRLSAAAENLVSVRTLRYMVLGGRVSPLKGLMARVMNLKPIVSVDKQGKSVLYGKAFSIKANEKKILDMAKGYAERSPLASWAVVHAHAEADARAFARKASAVLGSEPAYMCEISSIIAMNSGRGAVSFVCVKGPGA